MPIMLSAVDNFLNRNLRDSAKAKIFTPEAIDAKLEALDTLPRFYTQPKYHCQKVSFLLGIMRPRYVFLLDPGLGKTWVSLNLFAYRKMIGEANRMFALVPYTANLTAWYDEIKKHTPRLSVDLVDATGRDDRLSIVTGAADIVVCTYAGFLGLICEGKPEIDDDGNLTGKTKGWQLDDKQIKPLQRMFQQVTLDEMQLVLGKHDSTMTKGVRKLVKHVPFRYGLTGTPFGKEPMKAWSQFDLLDDGDTLGETLGLFRGAFYNSKPGFFGGVEYTFRKDRQEDFNRMIRHGSIRYTQEEVFDLPDTVYNEVEVSWPAETWAYYEKAKQELIDGRGNFMVINNGFMRMRQLAAGWLSFKDGEEARHDVVFKSNPKLDALVGWAKTIPYDRKAIIFCDLIGTGDLIEARFRKEKLAAARLYSGTKDKAAELRRFETSAQFLISSKSGGTGLNLQFSNYIAMYETPTEPDVRIQMERRQRRTGQRFTCFVTDFIMRNSVDRKILNSLKGGIDLQKALLDGGVYEGD